MVQTVQNSVEIPQLQFAVAVHRQGLHCLRGLLQHFAAFFALRPHGREYPFSALDDEEFFVIKGSGWRGRRESDSQVFCRSN